MGSAVIYTIRKIIPLQLLAIAFSLSSACLKIASSFWSAEGLLSADTLLWMGGAMFILMVYAYFWQMILVKYPLSVAYLNKSTTILWSLLWAALVFGEHITTFNLLGIACVFTGVILVSCNE